MTIEQIDRIVRHANPVPDVQMLESADMSDLHIEQWREDMQTHEKVEVASTEDPPRRGLWIGLAAAAVAIVVAILVVIQNQSEPPVADTPPPDEPVVTVAPEETPDGQEALATSSGFMDAKASYDTSTVLAYLAEDAAVDMGPAIDVATVADETAWQQASGLSLTPDGCDWLGSTTDGRGDQTRCYAIVSSPVSNANGSDPGRFTFDFIVVDGVIESAVISDLDNYSPAIWEPFEEWVQDNRATDHDTMFNSAGTGVVLTTESLQLWEQYTAEYVAEQDPAVRAALDLAEAYISARDAGEFEEAISYLATDATLDWGPGTTPETLEAGIAWEHAFGVTVSLDNCTASSTEDPVTVECSVQQVSEIADARGDYDPTSCVLMTIENDLITGLELGCGEVFAATTWAPFTSWLSTAHPEIALDDIYNDSRLTPEGAALWGQLKDEFVTELTS